MIEGAPEIRSRPQGLLEQGIAEIGPVAPGRASERGAPRIGRGQHDRVIVGERLNEHTPETSRDDHDPILDRAELDTIVSREPAAETP